MERVFTGRELVNTSSRLERNAALLHNARDMNIHKLQPLPEKNRLGRSADFLRSMEPVT